MPEKKSVFMAALALSLLTVLFTLNLNTPTDTQAGPLAGFTPQPPPQQPPPPPPQQPPPPPPPVADDDDDDDGEPPTDYVIIIIDQCNLTCSVTSTNNPDEPDFEPLASMGEGDQSSPLLKPINPPELAPELLAPVQLVHQGSGFIVEGVISNLKNTRFSLPYPGRWEVFLTAQPEIVSPQASNDSGLRASLAEGQWTLPASMGIVEANSSVPQSVDCPLNCVKPPPDTLPETGITLAQDNSLIATLIVAGLSLILIGLHFIWPRGLAFLDIKLENLFK